MRIVIRRYEAILIGSVMLLSGFVIPSTWDPPVQKYVRPPIDMPPQRPWIALTFDDGPHPVMTERLLEILKQQHVPATFFVVGKMADRYPQIVEEIAEDGNEVANHTYSHRRLTLLNNDEVMNELAQTRASIRRITGRDSCLFRPPGGDYSRRMVLATSRAGYHMVLWSVLTNDVQGASMHMITSRILKGANDGGIILMHSGVKNTVKVLPQIIEQLRDRGFHFVTVSTLLGMPSPDLYAKPTRRAVETVTAGIPTEKISNQ